VGLIYTWSYQLYFRRVEGVGFYCRKYALYPRSIPEFLNVIKSRLYVMNHVLDYFNLKSEGDGGWLSSPLGPWSTKLECLKIIKMIGTKVTSTK